MQILWLTVAVSGGIGVAWFLYSLVFKNEVKVSWDKSKITNQVREILKQPISSLSCSVDLPRFQGILHKVELCILLTGCLFCIYSANCDAR